MEVKHETKEAVFEVLGTEGETETYEVSSGKYIGVWGAVAQRVVRRVLIKGTCNHSIENALKSPQLGTYHS